MSGTSLATTGSSLLIQPLVRQGFSILLLPIISNLETTGICDIDLLGSLYIHFPMNDN